MGLEDTAARRPARMSIANVATGKVIEAQFNPAQLEESLEVTWARPVVPGLSHQPLQFVQTGNTKFTLELNFDGQDPSSSLDQILYARRFLQSLCYPGRGAQDVASGGPPRVLFVWPQTVSLTCIITALAFRYERFNVAGAPIQFTARVTLEEIADLRITSEDVLSNGSQRSGAATSEL